MVSDRHVLVAQAIEALNRRDLGGLFSNLMDPEFTFYSALRQMEGDVYRGRDGMRAYFDAVDSTWHDFTFELEQCHDVGDRTALVLRIRGTAKASGVPLDQLVGQVWTWRAHKVRQVDGYSGPAEALGAVGLG